MRCCKETVNLRSTQSSLELGSMTPPPSMTMATISTTPRWDRVAMVWYNSRVVHYFVNSEDQGPTPINVPETGQILVDCQAPHFFVSRTKSSISDASLKMFRKVLSNLPKIPPVQLQSNINPLPQRTLFTSTVVRHFDKDVDSITFYSSNKKFYVDIKQSDCPAEKYLKIVELSGGRRATLKVERGDVQELLKTLIKITQNSSNRKQIAFDSNSNKKKFYEVEKGGRSGEGNRWKVLIISENHHDGNKFRVWVPHEVWGHMIHNIGVLYKEHIAGTSSPHDSSLI